MENKPEENDNTNPENINTDKAKEVKIPIDINPVLLGIEKLLTIIEGYIQIKYKHDHKGLWIFAGLVVAILGTIITLACLNKINEASIGTILGSIIGYALGKFNNNGNGNNR
jgi:hypothetical protein